VTRDRGIRKAGESIPYGRPPGAGTKGVPGTKGRESEKGEENSREGRTFLPRQLFHTGKKGLAQGKHTRSEGGTDKNPGVRREMR